ncbi:protein CutA homolog [Drosophila teissieri]|uniref:protein CutA homolog n=1 Tax=Drosophila teissieri TaxID=7243 RepID=UPI001CBA5252|nr:protein CutA homolog [Drosophila teissieri]
MQYRICARFLPFRWSLVRNLLIAASVTTAIAVPPAFATASSCFSSSAASSNSTSSACSKMGDQPAAAEGSSAAGQFAYQAGSSSVAFVTTPDRECAKKLARSIIERKLAACVNIVPQIDSIYMWEGKITEDSEYLMMIKTLTSRIDDLTKFVRENHPYSVAEVISLPIQNGNPPYLDWIAQTVPKKVKSQD